MLENNQLSSILAGVSGEYFVAAELSRRGHLASITLRNTKGVDILCSNEQASKAIGIQVKTSRGSKRTWILNQKSEDYFADNLFYVFVSLNDNIRHPEFFIVASKIVAEYCTSSHKEWLNGIKTNGQERKDSSMRKFNDFNEEYLNNWSILGL